MKTALCLIALAAATPALASNDEAYAELDRRVTAACAKASGLAQPLVSPAGVRFSDEFGIDTRLVTGRHRAAHMKGAQTLMLCAYDRRAQRAEVQDAEAWWARRAR